MHASTHDTRQTTIGNVFKLSFRVLMQKGKKKETKATAQGDISAPVPKDKVLYSVIFLKANVSCIICVMYIIYT